MTLKQALQHARDTLQSHNIENPELTAEVLLRHILNITRVQLYQTLDDELKTDVVNNLRDIIQRHLNGEPVAYITGHKEFFGIDFIVDSRVLIPRPETELLVEKALQLADSNKVNLIADIGTGCGTIAVSLALKLTGVKIYATDISAPALEVAVQNGRKYRVADKICWLQGDLLEPLPEPVDIIVANLPYVKKEDIIKFRSLGFEPSLSLNGGEDGLSAIRQFCTQVKGKVKPGGSILMEIGQDQSETVKTLLLNCYPKAGVGIFRDFAGIERVVLVTI
ncbi:MAG: peptide chain release factor N(5)-glutamine methyltransferase [Dehalococcoidales bacterium]|nr:peptide chain release factor N(5)-glutamine methyltransferase [Dehalococcoidales bacterium]